MYVMYLYFGYDLLGVSYVMYFGFLMIFVVVYSLWVCKYFWVKGGSSVLYGLGIWIVFYYGILLVLGIVFVVKD